MKHFKIICIIFLAIVIAIPGLEAQTPTTLKGMSMNGATGLYSIPTAKTGWETATDFAFDLGYHAVFKDDKTTHIPKVSFSLFKYVELSAAFDLQPAPNLNAQENGTDFILGAKFQLPLSTTAIALGGNYQSLNPFNKGISSYQAGQVYVAISYAGRFFNMPAETTIVIGKTFGDGQPNRNLDFGMGFDFSLLPKVFKGYVHWITDFANFSYSVEPFGANSTYRGVINTGLRFDLTFIPPFKNFKVVLDAMITDAFDTDRAFAVGLVFGVPVL